jgi:FAD/FMN-containing dehydrogenase
MINKDLVTEFRKSLRGSLLEPHDQGYEDARKVYNGMINKHPGMIAQCSDVADVMRSVNFARENHMPLSVRGGGHSGAGLGVGDDCLVVDLSRIKYTRVDPVARTVVAGGGCTLGDIDHATHVFGLATPLGINGTTGIGGLATGGGLGHLTRKYGLIIDNLLSVDMVLADGTFVKANEEQNQDLFWAVRGGGGNFGIVTAFTFKLHPVSTIYAGPMLYEMNETEAVLKWYRKFILEAPESINGFFAFLEVPDDPMFPEHLRQKKMCGIVWACTEPPEKAEELFKPIRAFRKPALDFVGPLPHPVLQSMFDAFYPPGLQMFWRSHYIKEIPDEAIKIHIRFGEALPTSLSTMHLYPVNGAVSRVGRKETPWNSRDVTWSMVIVGVDPDPANNQKITDWAKQYWEAIHPYSAGGAYINFMMEEGDERVRATYGENYERLKEIKKKYDPDNLFRINQNIKPLAKSEKVIN